MWQVQIGGNSGMYDTFVFSVEAIIKLGTLCMLGDMENSLYMAKEKG